MVNLNKRQTEANNSSLDLQAELSRRAYEATGGVRENYRNNENPNINLGGQEALQQFKKINPLTAEMIREYKEDEINKYKGEYIKPELPQILPPAYISINGYIPNQEDINKINSEIGESTFRINKYIEHEQEILNTITALKAKEASLFLASHRKAVRDNYIKPITNQLKEVQEMVKLQRENIDRLTYLKGEYERAIKENKKIELVSSQENKEAIYKYEQDLKNLNMNRLNVIKQPDETEYAYFERLKAIADTKHDEEFYKDKAKLNQIKKLKDNLRKIIRDESKIEEVIKYLDDVNYTYEVNKYFPLIEEEFLKVFGYNNKNLSVSDIVKNISTILLRMTEVTITEKPFLETENKGFLNIGNNIYFAVESNKLIIGNNKNGSVISIFPVSNSTGNKKWFLVDKGSTEDPENYERAIVADIHKFLGVKPNDLDAIFSSSSIPALAEELEEKYKLEPLIDEAKAKKRGRPKRILMSEK